MRWRIFLPICLVLLALGLSAQRSRHRLDQPKTLTSVETNFSEDGAIKATTYTRRTWRADGSEASDSVRVVQGSRASTHGRVIQDLAAKTSSSLYFDLGVMTILRLPDNAAHDLHVRASDCAANISAIGVANAGNEFLRTVKAGNTERVLRFDPELGCQITESAVEVNGQIVSRVEVVSETDGTDEALFEIDPTMKPVTRVGLMAAFQAKYNVPLFDGPVAEGIVTDLDANNPLVTEQE